MLKSVMKRGKVMEKFIIKKATRKDVKTIVSYIKKHAEFAEIRDRCNVNEKVIEASFFQNQHAMALIGFEEDIPAGIGIYFYNYSSLTGERGIFIEDLFIDIEKRGLGYGRAILNHIFEIAKAEKIKKIDWYCLNDNEKAIKMYKNMGAEQESELTVFTFEPLYSK